MVNCSKCIKREKCKCESVDLNENILSEEEQEETNKKIETLNNLDVVEYDSEAGEIVYIHVYDDNENIKILRELGATDEDFEKMRSGMEGTDCLDIMEFAFCKLNAGCWSPEDGFKVFHK